MRFCEALNGLKAWIKLITFYEIAVGMKTTWAISSTTNRSPFSIRMKSGFSPTTIEGCRSYCVTTTAPTSVWM